MNKKLDDFIDELIQLMNKHEVYVVIKELGLVKEGFSVAGFSVNENILYPVLMGDPDSLEEDAEPLN